MNNKDINVELKDEIINIHMPYADRGLPGKSAYELAVENGFVGTESDWLASLIGPQGEQGIQGEKGDTYQVTEEDLKAIAKEITDNANSDFNKNVTDKTNLFNTNAEIKTTDYNSNANEKTTDFNTNAENKKNEFDTNVANQTKTFNDNASSKLDLYNQNDTTKTNAFNDNATTKTTAFNDNASNKTTYYNNNATTKLNEYNTNASTKLQEYNTNADNKIAEYDLHSEELDNKIVSTRNELERVKNDILETGTDTDTYIHLEDSAMAEYQELSVDGVCEQETTTGKNLFDESIMPINTNMGIKWEYTNKKIKISGTATSTYSQSGNISITLQAGTYYFVKSGTTNLNFNAWFYNIDGTLIANSALNNPFTISENATKIVLFVDGIKSGTSYNQEMNFMVSTINGNYEPYTGGQPSPSPDHPQPISTIENSLKITSCNKNLLNVSKYSDNNYVSQKLFIPVGEYTVKYIGDTSDAIYVRKANGTTPINGTPIIERYNINQLRFTITESGEYYIQFYKSKNGFTLFENAQFEKGTTATPYEQHLETQITANLPEGEFIGKINDTYKDTLKVEYNEEDGQYHLNLYKKLGRVTFTNENIDNYGINYVGLSYNHECVTIPKTKLGWESSWENHIAIMNKYTETTNLNVNNGNFSLAFSKGNVSIWNDDFTSLETAKNTLIGTEIYIALANPYVVDLGIVDQLITYNETTNLFTDSDLMPQINAKYYRNFISTVRNLQVNEKALKQELIDINNRLSALETAQTSVVSESEVTE